MTENKSIIKTPHGMPDIAEVIKYWAYREYFGDKRPRKLIYQSPWTSNPSDPLQALRFTLAEITSPERPTRHIDNHSGWEVKYKDGRRAVLLYSDYALYIFEILETKEG